MKHWAEIGFCLLISMLSAGVTSRISAVEDQPAVDTAGLATSCRNDLFHNDRGVRIWAAHRIAEHQLAECESELHLALSTLLGLPSADDFNEAKQREVERDFLIDALLSTGGHTTAEHAAASTDERILALHLANADVATISDRLSTLTRQRPLISPVRIMLLNRWAEIDPLGYVRMTLQTRRLVVNVTITDGPRASNFMAIGAGGGVSGQYGFDYPREWPRRPRHYFNVLTADTPLPEPGTADPRVLARGPHTVVLSRTYLEHGRAQIDNHPRLYLERVCAWLAGITTEAPARRQSLSVLIHDATTAADAARQIDAAIANLRAPWQARLDALVAAELIDLSDPSLLAEPPVAVVLIDARQTPTPLKLPLNANSITTEWRRQP